MKYPYYTFKYDTDQHHKKLNNHKDGAIIDIAQSYSKLHGEMSILMKYLITNNMLKLRTNLDTMIIDHDTQLKATADDIKQDTRAEPFLEIQGEKDRIKRELIADLKN